MERPGMPKGILAQSPVTGCKYWSILLTDLWGQFAQFRIVCVPRAAPTEHAGNRGTVYSFPGQLRAPPSIEVALVNSKLSPKYGHTKK